jgi:hypothetical protein
MSEKTFRTVGELRQGLSEFSDDLKLGSQAGAIQLQQGTDSLTIMGQQQQGSYAGQGEGQGRTETRQQG